LQSTTKPHSAWQGYKYFKEKYIHAVSVGKAVRRHQGQQAKEQKNEGGQTESGTAKIPTKSSTPCQLGWQLGENVACFSVVASVL